jgi:hypothetical protein
MWPGVVRQSRHRFTLSAVKEKAAAQKLGAQQRQNKQHFITLEVSKWLLQKKFR